MTQEKARLFDLIAELENKYTASENITLVFGRCVIRIRTNTKKLSEKLRRYYHAFILKQGEPDIKVTVFDALPPDFQITYRTKRPDPGKTKIKEEYADLSDGRIVRKRLTGMLFLFGKGLNYAIGPALENDNQVINFVNNRYIEWLLDRKYLLAHASGIDWKGKGLAIAAASGSGKSTLALRLLSDDCNFVSNDRLLIKRHSDDGAIDMLGIPKYPRINPGTIINNKKIHTLLPDKEKDRLKSLPSGDLWNLEQKYDVFLDEYYGEGKFTLSSVLKGIVILNWSRKHDIFKVKKTNFIKQRELLTYFMKPVGLFYDIAQKGLSDLSEDVYFGQLQDCPVLEFCGAIDFEKAGKVCMDFLATVS